jgi:hypothetical protein
VQDYAHTLVAKLPAALTQDVPIGSDRLNLLNFIISLSMGTGSGDHAAFTAYARLPPPSPTTHLLSSLSSLGKGAG